MNPVQTNPSGGQGLPDSAGEMLPGTAGIHESAPLPLTAELAGRTHELPSSGGPGSAPGLSLTDESTSVMAALNPAAAATVSASHSAAPTVAEDADLIEKEWVLRAKALVAKTKEDPHEQNKELNLYKADYIKKRYNKDVKVSEG